jgi:hypothetical protein
MSIMSTPGGSVGCTSTGSARRSISRQIGSNSGSVRLRPAMLASTMTPTAPLAHVRASSSIARCGYSQGSDVNQRMRSGYVDCACAIVSFDSRAAWQLTSSVPQYTLGQVSDTIEMSMPAASMCASRSA